MMFAYTQTKGSLKAFPKGWVGIHYDIITYNRELTSKELKKHDMKRLHTLLELSPEQQETFQKLQVIEKETIQNIMKGLVK